MNFKGSVLPPLIWLLSETAMIFSCIVILLDEVLTIVLELVMLDELVVIDVDPVVILVEVLSAL